MAQEKRYTELLFNSIADQYCNIYSVAPSSQCISKLLPTKRTSIYLGLPSPPRALFTTAFARFNSTAILLNKSPLLSLEDQDQASKCTFKMYFSTALAFAVSAMTVVSAVALPKPNVNVIIKVEVCTNPVLYYFCPIYPCIIWSPRPKQQHI